MTTHYAPTYRLTIHRPTGELYAVVDGLPSTLAVEQRANIERGAIRSSRGWTPTFRAYYHGQDGHHDVTRLCRLF